ncbi:MAG: cysteine--tRNA ligase [Candidatus Nealsonbacteria bacterium]|nr:cysteine--tRNA ligase [Candidatus Nealsonbacteria bacterium]
MDKIKFYNTLTRKKQEFKPLKNGFVGVYSCGPTVYWNQHIGHMYAYVQWDVLVRFLRYLGYRVKWVMNITDVGHLTSDEDAGEDKMEKGAKREGLSVWEIADKYIKQFTNSLDLLNIKRPDVLCRATDHIKEQIALIKKIEKNGFAYKTKTGLVFDTTKFPDYAQFARLNLKKQFSGSRVEVDPEKKKPWDFLLWVTNQPEHIMKWESPWGTGFPGWHIECTGMSTKYLGQKFDIHTGGKEHVPVHHTNEVAQAFGAFGSQTANFWLHNDWLVIEGEKMSKSLGNMVTAQDLAAKGFNPLALRYLVLTSHYHQGLNFTWEGLGASQKALDSLYAKAVELKIAKPVRQGPNLKKYQKRFVESLSQDLGVAQALALTWQMLKDKTLKPAEKYELLVDFDRVLGLKIAQTRPQSLAAPEAAKKLVEQRERLRQEKKWAEADRIRQKVEKLGWRIEDTPKGTQLKKK